MNTVIRKAGTMSGLLVIVFIVWLAIGGSYLHCSSHCQCRFILTDIDADTGRNIALSDLQQLRSRLLIDIALATVPADLCRNSVDDNHYSTTFQCHCSLPPTNFSGLTDKTSHSTLLARRISEPDLSDSLISK